MSAMLNKKSWIHGLMILSLLLASSPISAKPKRKTWGFLGGCALAIGTLVGLKDEIPRPELPSPQIVWNTPKYRTLEIVMGGGMAIVGASVFLRYRREAKHFQDQIRGAKSDSQREKANYEWARKNMAPTELRLTKARYRAMRSLQSLSKEEREALVKEIASLDISPAEKEKAVGLLSREESLTQVLTPETALMELEMAFDAYVEAAAFTSQRLNAWGHEITPPTSRQNLVLETEANVRLLTTALLTKDASKKMRTEVEHIAELANEALDKNAGPWTWAWRKSRMALLLGALTVAPLAITMHYDAKDAAKTREENLVAAEETSKNRGEVETNLISAAHRPWQRAMYDVWMRDPRLSQFDCPIGSPTYGIQDPSLAEIQVVLLAARQALQKDIAASPQAAPSLSEDVRFFSHAFEILFASDPALMRLPADYRADIISDMSSRVVRYWDDRLPEAAPEMAPQTTAETTPETAPEEASPETAPEITPETVP